MKHDLKAYVILSTIFALSILGGWLFDANELLQSIVVAPGVLSLIGALYQLIRDQAAFEKQLNIQEREFQYSLGAASHMANAAFDKHIQFCEKYMKEIHTLAHLLFREADTPEVLKNAGNLYEIREEFALWLTDDINTNLEMFESAIRKLGAQAHFIEKTRGIERHAEQRSLRIDENHELFIDILGIDSKREVNEEYAVEAIKRKVRKILGVEELTLLRSHLVDKASRLAGHT